jgi:hypothetical protein
MFAITLVRVVANFNLVFSLRVCNFILRLPTRLEH